MLYTHEKCLEKVELPNEIHPLPEDITAYVSVPLVIYI